jgi:hypothetical protein
MLALTPLSETSSGAKARLGYERPIVDAIQPQKLRRVLKNDKNVERPCRYRRSKSKIDAGNSTSQGLGTGLFVINVTTWYSNCHGELGCNVSKI